MTEPKLCKDCKHHSRSFGFHRCGVVRDPITGKPGAFADIERQGCGHDTDCGSDGRLFEPKPPGLLSRLFRIHRA